MTVLVVGASGATGQLLVRQLVLAGQDVKAVIRQSSQLPEDLQSHGHVSVVHADIYDMSSKQMAELLKDCDAVASCLGHNLSFKGMFCHPRLLVTDTVRRLCQAIDENRANQVAKFVLMNTTGNINRDLAEQVSFAQNCVLGLLRLLLPPHVDNERAAEYLRTEIGKNHACIEWVAVRPDGLINEEDVTDYGDYDVHPSPIRSAIFDAGKTSRINVAHFMAELIVNKAIWNRWKGQMPVIYNRA